MQIMLLMNHCLFDCLWFQCSPYPSDEDMQMKLKVTVDWDAFRNSTFEKTLHKLSSHKFLKKYTLWLDTIASKFISCAINTYLTAGTLFKRYKNVAFECLKYLGASTLFAVHLAIRTSFSSEFKITPKKDKSQEVATICKHSVVIRQAI